MRIIEAITDKEIMAHANKILKNGNDQEMAQLARDMVDIYAKTGLKDAAQVVISNLMNQFGMKGQPEHFEQSILKDQYRIDNFRELFQKSVDITHRDPLDGSPV